MNRVESHDLKHLTRVNKTYIFRYNLHTGQIVHAVATTAFDQIPKQ